MTDKAANNKRIAKNTLLLYFRMIILMLVSLYTSRVVLDALGEADYGIYNVVGGLVAMFSVLSGSLSSSISRYITYELGTGNLERLKKVFCTSVNIQILLALLIFLLCEVIGVWFLNEKMNIPTDRLTAANVVLHCSILTFMVNLISIPYNATIIAHEKMNVFAYISILEAGLKLMIAYFIYVSSTDKLVIYASMMLGVSIILRLVYSAYCNQHFIEARYRFVLDRSLLKEMFSFAGWNFFGNTAYLLNTQGVNMLINIFFGVTTNAARAIAVQVDGAVTQFVNNFTTAINPQITKSYASTDYNYLYKLICRGTKYSFFIMYIFIVPIMLEADTLLNIWLKKVPEDATIFLRLVLLSSLATVLGNSMFTAIMATGKIKRYQITVTLIGCLVFPFTWIAYKLGCPAYMTYIIYALVYFSLNFIRLSTLKRLIAFPVRYFYRTVFCRISYCAVLSFLLPSIILYLMPPSFLRLILVCLVSLPWSLINIFYIGLEKEERTFFTSKIRNFINKRLYHP